MSDHILPTQKKPKLIVVVAFDRSDDGDHSKEVHEQW